MPITRHYLTITSPDGATRRVHYRKCGSGPPLLMIHQSPRSSAEYEALMLEWGEQFTCIAPDTPGFGQSDPVNHPAPEIGEYADAIAEFVDALGIAPCAAYGFHSGGIILVTALKRRPELFTGLAVGGYAVWTQAEMDLFGDEYLPEFRPAAFGEHLTWLWNRILEQSWYFPWFDVRDEARLSVAHADPQRVNDVVMEMLDSGEHYRAGYGAVLRAPRDIPAHDAQVPPCLITAYDGDPLQAHIDRLGEMPEGWSARKVRTVADHREASRQFLLGNAGAVAANYPEDADAGWVHIGGEAIHWRGARDAKQLIVHAPGAELADPQSNEVAIDVPGHGLSSPGSDFGGLIDKAANELGASKIIWPDLPQGSADALYPDLTPDRFGGYLGKAWSVARAQAIFDPWYKAETGHEVPLDPAALKPAAIALRARAMLRAGPAAKAFHQFLQSNNKDRP